MSRLVEKNSGLRIVGLKEVALVTEFALHAKLCSAMK